MRQFTSGKTSVVGRTPTDEFNPTHTRVNDYLVPDNNLSGDVISVIIILTSCSLDWHNVLTDVVFTVEDTHQFHWKQQHQKGTDY